MPESHDADKPRKKPERRLPPRLPSPGEEGEKGGEADARAQLPGYAELHCISNFSFQRGASHAEELVLRAYELGYAGLAVTDECSVAGTARAHIALRDYVRYLKEIEDNYPGVRYTRDFKLLYGSEFALEQHRLVVIARNLQGWGNLCEFISTARRGDEVVKGDYHVDELQSHWASLTECEVLFAPRRDRGEQADLPALRASLRRARQHYGDRLWLAAELLHALDDELWLATLQQLGEETGVPLVAAGDVHMHVRSRKALQDVITAVREGKPVSECGFALQPNAERHLRHRSRLARIYPQALLANTLKVMARCDFSLEEIKYNYPKKVLQEGMTPAQALRKLTMEGMERRFPEGASENIRALVKRELELIAKCEYEMFFLTVENIVRFAREKRILCQGRGSAANSVVCYCLGITAADPEKSHPLLERFISEDRKNEPPDIDVDFEHERREEVIQYVYETYGRDRAAIAAVVITYRTRSAIRDVGKALGIAEVLIDAFAKEHQWFDDGLATQKLRDMAHRCAVPLEEHQARLWLELTVQLKRFPRHLSQHVGGFVLTEDRLTRLVPIEKASMKDRAIIQWDKDDLEQMGLMKVDVLALGMLTALRRCLDFRRALHGEDMELHQIPNEDPKTYAMIRRADTVGVFQIESRAQMSMLPRLKPKEFYDLVVEVAIVRPGPISGGMVHPYLKARERRDRGEEIVYERSLYDGVRPRLQDVLERTLGIPIFQEQVMQISIVAAGFTASQADALRRAMAAWKRNGCVDRFERQLIDGMVAHGYSQDFAQRIFRQVEGFGDYGFPESHAYSFALLAYGSSWLKCHEPECFLAAMLNSQPMGFYTPSQLIQDAKKHGVQVRPADVCHSDHDCTLELGPDSRFKLGSDSNFLPRRDPSERPVVRLGLRLVGSFGEASAKRVMQARAEAPFTSTEDLALRAQLDLKDLNALAAADALVSLSGHRRQQVWDAAAQQRAPTLLRQAPVNETPLALPAAPEGEEIVFDYAAMGLTLRRHPLALLRRRLARMHLLNADQLRDLPNGQKVQACGIVTVRQQPQTAKGTIFVTLEDETGPVNVIVWKDVRERYRDALLRARLLAVQGVWQRDVDSGGQVRHVVAHRLEDLTPLLGRLGRQSSKSRDFH
jgi:error-prone DNA polymerase